MVGFSDEARHLPTSRQALNRTHLLFPVFVFTILLASLITTGSVSAQESAACDQYGCAEGSAACGQYGCTADPAPEEPAPAERTGPTAAGTPATESEPELESSDPVEENVDVLAPPAVHQDVPASEQYSESYQITPPPGPDPITAGGEPLETEHTAAPSKKPAEQSTETASTSTRGNGDGDGSGESTEEPLPGYHYDGKPCEESNCGLEEVEAPVECAAYETASGQTVYGCSNPKTYAKKGCYEITFYTADGKPYSNLDTCSGEKPYAPPEPPERDFEYWEPPEDKRVQLDPYDHWNGADREESLCRNNSGDVQWYCGLDVPKTWNCGVFYGTIHGTARGCFEQNDYAHGDCYDVHLYDEVGNHLGIYQECSESQEKLCGEDQCGLEREVPARWECERVEHSYWGDLYGSDRRVAVYCEDPILIKKLESGNWINYRKTCAVIFDENGQAMIRMPCTPQGNSHVGKKAGKDAREADQTLNGHGDPASLAGGSSLPNPGGWEASHFSEGQAPGAQTGLESDAASSNSSLPDGKLLLPIDISDLGVATLDQDEARVSSDPGSSPTEPQPADPGLPGEDTSQGAKLTADSAGSKTSGIGDGSTRDSSYASPNLDAIWLEAERRALEENQTRVNSNPHTPYPGGNASSGAIGTGQYDRAKDLRWPEITDEFWGAVASFLRFDSVGGWLGNVIPLAGLGAVSGIFVLRKGFLR